MKKLWLLLALGGLLGCGESQEVVVVYVSEDQVFAEPILREFESETGIKVKAVYDTEESKSTGVVNRLIAEKDNPQADVYWANEPIRAEILKQKGVAAPYVSPQAEDIPRTFKDPQAYWTGFSARVRVLVVNEAIGDSAPGSVEDYTNPRWAGRAVMANPLFGTTTSHIAALFVLWGDDSAKAFMERMKTNRVAVSSSNGESADMVAAGEFDFSLVDSDDAVSRMRRGEPVFMVYPDQAEGQTGCFVVPNAVVLIKGAPHEKNAKRLVDFLLSRDTEAQLAAEDCAQIPLHPGVKGPPELKPLQEIKVMPVDYGRVASKISEIQNFLKTWVGY